MSLYQISRDKMVSEQLIKRGITDKNVISAMRKVSRHLFVEEGLIGRAYGDFALPLGVGKTTISQPYVVAMMSQLLEASPGQRILEIGTGSGYQAAILSEMGLEVYTVERLKELYFRTSNLLIKLRYRGIKLKLADGTEGWPEVAPFDRIIVTAGGPSIPKPLVDQLADPGIMVIPVGDERREQAIVVLRKNNGQIIQEKMESVSFVDLVGNHGW